MKEHLKLELHPDKTKIVSLSKSVDFVGFRNSYYFKLLRNRNIKNMQNKLKSYFNGKIVQKEILDFFKDGKIMQDGQIQITSLALFSPCS
ncbi:MAG: hypothetical protein U9Q06_02395 [Nanoarchaeota archaeon]|nr:hypothetical protein [Nanoarchaeota archaeon]